MAIKRGHEDESNSRRQNQVGKKLVKKAKPSKAEFSLIRSDNRYCVVP